MRMYILYRIGHFLAVTLPVKVTYRIACMLADLCFTFNGKDRIAIKKNLAVILKDRYNDAEAHKIARELYRNFAKYLVDFFRFEKIDKSFLAKFVKVEGIEYIERARDSGNGVIVISAHMGNWELGGHMMPLLGYPISAVVLTHKNKKVNEFFTKQRRVGSVEPIEIGLSLRACYNILKNKGFLALLGDRDFSRSGIVADFFGKPALLPKGPAVFGYKTGARIVPCFMVREPDDTFRMIFDEPIIPDTANTRDAEVRRLIDLIARMMEKYIVRYPNQWYAFKPIWEWHDQKDMRSHSVL